MATDIHVSQIQTKSQQYAIGLTSHKPIYQIYQKVDSQGAAQCGALCPLCRQDGYSGACGLDAGHGEQHQCNRDSSHRWSEAGPEQVPGPH